MFLEVLGHAEGLDLLGSEHGGHGLVGGEPLLVLGILEVVLLQVGPETLDDLQNINYLRFVENHKQIRFRNHKVARK